MDDDVVVGGVVAVLGSLPKTEQWVYFVVFLVDKVPIFFWFCLCSQILEINRYL